MFIFTHILIQFCKPYFCFNSTNLSIVNINNAYHKTNSK